MRKHGLDAGHFGHRSWQRLPLVWGSTSGGGMVRCHLIEKSWVGTEIHTTDQQHRGGFVQRRSVWSRLARLLQQFRQQARNRHDGDGRVLDQITARLFARQGGPGEKSRNAVGREQHRFHAHQARFDLFPHQPPQLLRRAFRRAAVSQSKIFPPRRDRNGDRLRGSQFDPRNGRVGADHEGHQPHLPGRYLPLLFRRNRMSVSQQINQNGARRQSPTQIVGRAFSLLQFVTVRNAGGRQLPLEQFDVAE